MASPVRCPECGAIWTDDQTCTDHFHTMCAWELDHQLYDQHHLMVLCYHLQHPSLYSPETLIFAQKMLVDFLEQDITPQAMRQQISKSVDSGTRNHKVTGTPESHGAYAKPVEWKMCASDVTCAGINHYYDSVRQWAELTLKSLRESGNLE